MIVITVKNLIKHFGKVKAVDGISFNVDEGEVFGYLGPNGAGKTTTISCMMGFLNLTGGEISIMGKDVIKESTSLKHDIGYLSSDVHLYQDLTGNDHFRLIEAIRGKSPILKQLIRDLSYNPKVKVKNLSTGNKQKLGVIMCFMHQPKLLILDEPTRGLDPLLQNKVYEYILNFKKDGTTIFMSSHNLGEVEKLCDHLAIIRTGKLVALETLSTLKEKRIHMVRAYFKDTPHIKDIQMSGVEDFEKLPGNGISFKVKGDITPVIQKISKFNLYDLEITHASLEALFMEFYK